MSWFFLLIIAGVSIGLVLLGFGVAGLTLCLRRPSQPPRGFEVVERTRSASGTHQG